MTKIANIFYFSDYRAFLRELVDGSAKGFVTRLAEAAGCQRSYMSDVLRTSVQLTPDHAFGISEFLKLSPAETEFFLNLVHHARASSKGFRTRLAAKLDRERKDQARLTKRLGAADSAPEGQMTGRYYSSWPYAAVHIATSIVDMHTPKAVAARLGLSETLVLEVLHHLVEDGYVVEKQGGFRFNLLKDEPHLSDRAIFSRMNHANWRTLALSRPAQPAEDVQYSSVFAIAKADYPHVRDHLLQCIAEQRDMISQSGCEDIHVFTCDLFRM